MIESLIGKSVRVHTCKCILKVHNQWRFFVNIFLLIYFLIVSFQSILLFCFKSFLFHNILQVVYFIKYNNHSVKSVQIQSFFSSVFGLNTRKYGPEITPYLDTFQTVNTLSNSTCSHFWCLTHLSPMFNFYTPWTLLVFWHFQGV